MPFVKQDHRDTPDIDIPGDLCYVHYRKMVDAWKAQTRWTTAHKIYKEVMMGRLSLNPPCSSDNLQDDIAAKELAWQVFFQLHVMDYERKKREENGDIQ